MVETVRLESLDVTYVLNAVISQLSLRKLTAGLEMSPNSDISKSVLVSSRVPLIRLIIQDINPCFPSATSHCTLHALLMA